MDAATTRFVIALGGAAVSAAVLILLVPSLLGSPGDVRLGVAGVLAILTAGFGLAARRWRRDLPGSSAR